MNCLKQNKADDGLSAMILTLAAVGILYYLVFLLRVPPYNMPDECNHFYRAFAISMGRAVSRAFPSGSYGDILPAAVVECGAWSSTVDWNDMAEVEFSNSSLYAFINYLPQATGIFIARHFTDRVPVIYHAGRLANLLAAFALCALALKTIPFGRRMLFVIMLFPMTLQDMVSTSPDALIDSLSFVLMAVVLDISYRETAVTGKDAAAVGILLALVALCKIAYLGALLLLYIIPYKKMDRRGRILLWIVVPLIAVALNLLSLRISSKVISGSKLHGSDAAVQMEFILSHPLSYAAVFLRTIVAKAPFYAASCIGALLGALTIEVPIALCLVFLLLLLYVSACDGDTGFPLRMKDTAFFILIFLGEIGLILTGDYIGWTAPRAPIIEGVQGRYFTPLLPYLMLSVSYAFAFVRGHASRGRAKKGGTSSCRHLTAVHLCAVLIALNIITLIFVWRY